MIEINTYKDFFKYVTAFKLKNMNLLVVLSRGGLAKSYTVEDALIADAPLTFSGHVTPLALYSQIYERTSEDSECLIVFDDVDTLVMNKTNVALLKQLCDTKLDKTVRYSSSRKLPKDAPPQYQTSCKVILLTNNIKFKDNNIDALLTRGHLVYFNPSNEEVIRQLKSWAKENDIIEFMEKFAHFSKNVNMRTYKMAEELKKSGIDWQRFVIQELKIEPKLLIIHNLLQKYTTTGERVKEYQEVYRHSESDYHRYRKLYEKHCMPKGEVK